MTIVDGIAWVIAGFLLNVGWRASKQFHRKIVAWWRRRRAPKTGGGALNLASFDAMLREHYAPTLDLSKVKKYVHPVTYKAPDPTTGKKPDA